MGDRALPAALKQEELRRRMLDSADARVLRTRRKLVAAYRELLDEGSELTVTRVSRRAGVTRSSFYAHFGDTNDLATTALTEFSEAIISVARAAVRTGASTRHANRLLLVELVQFLDEHREVYRDLLVPGGGFHAAVRRSFTEQAQQTLSTREKLHADPDVTAHYVANGLLGVISWWLTETTQRSPEEVAAALIAVMPADFAD